MKYLGELTTPPTIMGNTEKRMDMIGLDFPSPVLREDLRLLRHRHGSFLL